MMEMKQYVAIIEKEHRRDTNIISNTEYDKLKKKRLLNKNYKIYQILNE